jgi:hypothetical protein
MNTVAFERRCIRPGCVALLAAYFTVRLSRAPCRMRRINALDANRIHELAL